MSEEGWLWSKIKVSIDALMMRREEGKFLEEKEEAELLYLPKLTGALYGLRIKCRPETLADLLNTLVNTSSIFLDEIYVKNYNEVYRIFVLVYVDKALELWKLIDRIVALEGIDKVNIIKPPRLRYDIPPVLMFSQLRINNRLMSLIPSELLCNIDRDTGYRYAEAIIDAIKGAEERMENDPAIFPLIIRILGLCGNIDERVDNDKYIVEFQCDENIVSDGYCIMLSSIAERLLNTPIEWVKEGGRCIVSIYR